MIDPNNLKPELLAYSTRGDNIEALHYGWICVLNHKKKIIFKKGNVSDKVFLRSAAKPIQAIPLIDNNIDITPKELSIICGSHSGSKNHLKILYNLIKKNNIKLSNLKCGIHLPSDESEKRKLFLRKISPGPLHNNCSGKHIGMLCVCKKNNWDLKGYLNAKHPLQKNILKQIQRLSGTKSISIATDGCGVPTFALPIKNIAVMFSNFTASDNNPYKKIITAMSKNPFYTGGENQIDTEIMQIANTDLIAKVGAEGIIIIAYKGNSAVIKIADGSPKARSFIALALLSKLNWFNIKKLKKSNLEELYNLKIKNHSGKIVGSYNCVI